MNLKKIIPITIILSILILCNGLHAEDTENTTQYNEISNVNEEYVEQTTVETVAELKAVFETVKESNNTNHEINISPKTYKLSQPLGGEFESATNKNIVINGNNAIIDGRNQRNFLTISMNINLTVNNLIITNMNYHIGSAICNSGTTTLNNVTFEHNIVENDDPSVGGAAIYTDSSMNIYNCVFKNNGGNATGSTIFINEQNNQDITVNINNCEFNNNNALNSSIIRILGKVQTNIQNSTFINENSIDSIILNEKSQLTIDNCTFNENNCKKILLNTAQCTINNTKFYNNKIENIIFSNDELTMFNSEISDNEIDTIITNEKNITLESILMNNNTIHESLLLNNIPNDDDMCYLNITRTIFSNNTSNKTCGIENKYDNMLTYISDSYFINNTSLLDEGILSDNYGTINVINSKFINNTAEDLFKGKITNYKLVQDNEYKGNFLKIHLNTSALQQENHLNISGLLKTDDIYNTTVNSGIITVKQENNLLYEENISADNINIDLIVSDNLSNITLLYDGIGDFRNVLKDMEISILEEKYFIEIKNISRTFIYGDYITFDLYIQNSGNITVNDLYLSDVLPNGLIYVNSTDKYDYINNEYHLSSLNVNEKRCITFYLIPNRYEDIDLEFNISDNKQNETYTISEEVKFIKPQIVINNVVAHPGEVINISAEINNYNKDSIDNIQFKFNYNTVEDFSYSLNNNTITIENYKLDEKLTKKNYNVELKCSDTFLEEFSNNSIVSVIKYNTYSIMNYNISNSYINLSISFFDEKDNLINDGSVILKINGKTVKTLKVNNGNVELVNYKLTSNPENEYNISITYAGNNKYNLHYNNSIAKESKKSVNFLINYDIVDNIITFSVKTINNENILPETGFVAIKINGKTILPQWIIQENYILTYDFSDIPCIHNITVAYYGNENFLESSKTISV